MRMTWKRELWNRTEGAAEPQLVSFGELLLPDRYVVEAEGPPLSYKVTMEVVCGPAGPEIADLRLAQVEGGPPITGEGLRFPLGRLLRASVHLVAQDDRNNPFSWPEDSAVTAAEQEMDSVRRRWKVTDDHLAEVARTYLGASGYRTAGQSAPTAAVAKEFRVSRATAGRWVMQAREKGLLPDREQIVEERRQAVADLKKSTRRRTK